MDDPHVPLAILEAGNDHLLASPRVEGPIELLIRRPDVDARELLDEATFTLEDGVVGDNWSRKIRSGGKPPHPDMQINVMNARVVAHLAGPRAADHATWALAGDQLYVDLDLSEENLPAGSRLQVGNAVLEVTAEPHTGCRKFAERFGKDAVRFVNSEFGRQHRYRGLNARVVTPGQARIGDAIRKLEA
ncbi:MAG: MOSC domain-containing protein [Planctomycetes bacterium]|nr:MOSC domain-containing protein [Planctomycetota bacterium]MCB9917272.1 MOSC domain-containing protein [Planctomycetota bacterium]